MIKKKLRLMRKAKYKSASNFQLKMLKCEEKQAKTL